MTTKTDRRRKKKLAYAFRELKKTVTRTGYKKVVCLAVGPEGLRVLVES